jgi:hypothetical protein
LRAAEFQPLSNINDFSWMSVLTGQSHVMVTGQWRGCSWFWIALVDITTPVLFAVADGFQTENECACVFCLQTNKLKA